MSIPASDVGESDFQADIGFDELCNLLQSPANAKRLMKAKEALEKGRGKVRKIDLGT